MYDPFVEVGKLEARHTLKRSIMHAFSIYAYHHPLALTILSSLASRPVHISLSLLANGLFFLFYIKFLCSKPLYSKVRTTEGDKHIKANNQN